PGRSDAPPGALCPAAGWRFKPIYWDTPSQTGESRLRGDGRGTAARGASLRADRLARGFDRSWRRLFSRSRGLGERLEGGRRGGVGGAVWRGDGGPHLAAAGAGGGGARLRRGVSFRWTAAEAFHEMHPRRPRRRGVKMGSTARRSRHETLTKSPA